MPSKGPIPAWGGAALLAAVLLGAFTSACTDVGAPAAEEQAAAQPAARPATSQTGAAAAADEPATVVELFPPGEGREEVLNTCGSCHNVACSVIGQRSPERWDALEESHRDKITGSDLGPMFAYLKAHFNDSQPEPKVPPRFLEGGCTPF